MYKEDTAGLQGAQKFEHMHGSTVIIVTWQNRAVYMGVNERTKPRKQKLLLEAFVKKVALERWFRERERENSRRGYTVIAYRDWSWRWACWTTHVGAYVSLFQSEDRGKAGIKSCALGKLAWPGGGRPSGFIVQALQLRRPDEALGQHWRGLWESGGEENGELLGQLVNIW